MTTSVKADLCVIGMDPAGYDLALAASQLGATVVLVTHGQTAGRVLLGSGQVFALMGARHSSPAELRDAINLHVAAADRERSVHRLSALGVAAIDETARFLSPNLLAAGDMTIAARRFLLATGRDSAVFPQENAGAGLNPFLAGEDLPRALRLIGHDAEAVTIAQKLGQAGIPVELDPGESGLLPRHDADAVAILATAIERDGVIIRAAADGVAPSALAAIDVSRKPPVSTALDPEKAGIALQDGRPILDARLRTTNRRVFAIGHVTQTAAEAEAGLVTDGANQIGWLIAKLLFRSFGRYPTPLAMRHVATSPAIIELHLPGSVAEIGHLRGMRIHREAIPAGAGAHGFIRVATDAKGRVLATVIIGQNAAELAIPWAAALQRREVLGALSGLPVLPGESANSARMLALQPVLRRLRSPRLQALVRFFAKFG